MPNKHLEPDALYWVLCNHLQFRIPGRVVLDICKSGSNDKAVAAHLEEVRQLTDALYQNDPTNPWRPTAESIRNELAEYGAWYYSELVDDEVNWARLLWIASWSIYEDATPDCSAPCI